MGQSLQDLINLVTAETSFFREQLDYERELNKQLREEVKNYAFDYSLIREKLNAVRTSLLDEQDTTFKAVIDKQDRLRIIRDHVEKIEQELKLAHTKIANQQRAIEKLIDHPTEKEAPTVD